MLNKELLVRPLIASQILTKQVLFIHTAIYLPSNESLISDPVRTGPVWQCPTEMVGTGVTQELRGVFTGKITKWKLKQWRARKKDDDDDNNNKILHNTVVWLRRLWELFFFFNATNCGYPQQQLYGLWVALFSRCEMTLERITPENLKKQIFMSDCALHCFVLLSEKTIAS